MSYIYSACAD